MRDWLSVSDLATRLAATLAAIRGGGSDDDGDDE